MLLRVNEGIRRDLLEEHSAARANLGHLDSHPCVGLPALIKGDCIGTASDLLPVPLAFDIVDNPPDSALRRIFIDTLHLLCHAPAPFTTSNTSNMLSNLMAVLVAVRIGF